MNGSYNRRAAGLITSNSPTERREGRKESSLADESVEVNDRQNETNLGQNCENLK